MDRQQRIAKQLVGRGLFDHLRGVHHRHVLGHLGDHHRSGRRPDDGDHRERQARHRDRAAPNDLAYLAVGWSIGQDGRKLFSGTALFDETGRRYGYARQTWIVLG